MLSRLFRKKHQNEEGQALVEFMLTIPILMLFIAGLIDFGVILFSYTQASGSLRTALRYGELLGYESSGYDPYLDCAGMADAVADSYFSDNHQVTITYVKSDLTEIDCGGPDVWTPPSEDDIETGDMLRIEVVANVDPFFLPINTLELHFQGQRSIVKAIPVGVGAIIPVGDDDDTLTDTDADTIPDIVDNCPTISNVSQDDADGDGYGDACDIGDGPEQPTDFEAFANCATGTVSFYWSPASPIPTKMEIWNSDDNLLVYTLEPAPAALCIDCDNIGSVDTKNYYVVAYNGPMRGPESAIDGASCSETPDAPINFTALCDNGSVHFTWNYTGGYPTSVEIRNQSDDSWVYDTAGGALSCFDCGTLSVPSSNDYYIVAINSTGGGDLESPHSSVATATCSTPDASVRVCLAHVPVLTDPCAFENTNYSNQTVELVNNNTSALDYGVTGADGCATFSGLAASNYTVTVPSTVSGHFMVGRDINGTCNSAGSGTWTGDLGAGAATNIKFGYE